MPKIFISYRRDDSAFVAQQLHEKLQERFGEKSIFIDVESIPPGADFAERLGEAIGQCDVLLAVIGDRWLDARYTDGPKKGQRRLEDPEDLVRIEIASALNLDIPVIPVLIGNISMAHVAPNLPPDLEKLKTKNATPVRAGRDLPRDLQSLARGIKGVLRLPPLGAAELALPPGIVVQPKGLHSFDKADAGFFIRLLPGPYAEDGLPENIQFWKKRIEETDPEQGFRVGVIYGPSGCGKSSLVKAALLPHLSGSVTAVYVEATADDTETRLLAALRRHCPRLSAESSLPAALRQREAIGEGRKVLIVLDQFEQWLHSTPDDEQEGLAEALRECDGRRLQCVVMVRDDFLTPVTRFMNRLQIPLRGDRNCMLVDLFDRRHAKKVLALLGQAYGGLSKSGAPSREQDTFLNRVISGLAEGEHVICVRLALFAQMVKAKQWTPATLKAIGGAQGVGVAFLEDSFAAESRRDGQAALEVLTALLPEPGTSIRGAMRTKQELLAKSGYRRRPDQFESLLGILDQKLRLVTPTGHEALDAEAGPQAAGEGRYYQLTHDYLVPSLRQWLSSKQKETWRGRAELRLAEHSVMWNDKPETHHLPAWWELLDILLFASRESWTDPQRKMMQKAERHHALRGLALAVLLAVLTVTGVAIRNQVDERSNASYAASLVQRLLDANVAQLPRIVDKINGYRNWTDPLLKAELEKAPENSAQKLHASLALLAVDPRQAGYLYERLLDAEPQAVPVIREALAPYKQALTDKLWAVAGQPPRGKESQRLRAASALAVYDPNNPRWQETAVPVADDLVNVPAVYLANWMESLRPVQKRLVPPLADIFRNATRSEIERSLTTDVLADYAGDQATVLVDLLLDASEPQFVALFPKLKKLGETGAKPLAAEIDKQLEPAWNDPLSNPAWKNPDASAMRQIEAAQGIVTERFAFCQTMPLPEFSRVVEALRTSGYRPTRFRPYPSGAGIQAAAVWTRDGRDWRMAHGLSSAEIFARDAEYRKESLYPVDVSAFGVGHKEQYAALWVRAPAESVDAVLQAGVDEKRSQEDAEALRKKGYRITVLSRFVAEDGTARISAIWAKAPGERSPWYKFFGIEPDYSGENCLGDLQVDVQVGKAAPVQTTRQRFSEQLAEAEKELQAKADDANARLRRAEAHLHLGAESKAREDLSWLIPKFPTEAVLFQYRAVANARLGKAKEARDDLAKFKQLSADPRRSACLDALVSAYLGEAGEGMKRLEAYLAAKVKDSASLYDAACVYSAASQAIAEKDRSQARLFVDRAVALLKNAVAAGYTNYLNMQTDADFDPIRQHPGYREILQAAHLERRYTAVWHSSLSFTSTEVHGLDPREHLARCRALTAAGYRPASLSMAETGTGPAVAASVWRRPMVPEDDKEKLARRQANAAVALLRLDRPEKVWPLLRHSPDPRVRSYLIHRLSPMGVDARVIVKRLGEESDLTICRALVLALGEYPDGALPPAEHELVEGRLREWYRTSADPGLHAAAEWALRRWKQEQWLKQSEEEWAKQSKSTDERRQPEPATARPQSQWYVNGQGQTMVVIPGPVEFLMGSPDSEAGRQDWELQYRKRIGRSFAVAAKLVSVEQYLRFRTDPDPKFLPWPYIPAATCPVLGMSWYQAAEYCNWLSKVEGLPETEWCYQRNAAGRYEEGMKPAPNFLDRTGYRLPTEAEWEYACRAGAVSRFYYGQTSELLAKYGWYEKNSSDRSWPLGSLKPNDLGLFDMHGDAWQWCHDSHGYYVPAQGGRAAEDVGDASVLLDTVIRVLRGGGFYAIARYVRSANRNWNHPGNRNYANGFRPARTCR